MTGPIDPLSKVGGRRQHRRRASDPPPADVEGANLPVPVGPAVEQPREARSDERREDRRGPCQPAATTLNAHLIGQENRRRGLRAGQPTLDAARATYLGAEYSGPADRRPRPGRITKTEI